MKRMILLATLLALCVTVLPAFAQDNSWITLNDATPSIDAVITLPQDSTGAVVLDFSGAAVTMTDASGAIVFSAADPRLHGLQLNITPNSGSHTLTITRLPGVTEALVRVTSLPELSQNGMTQLVTGTDVSFNQEVSLPLSATQPGGTVGVTVPDSSVGVVTATFPGANANVQLVDSVGAVVATAIGGNIDGVNLVLDAGHYQFTLVGTNLSSPIVAGVRDVSTTDAGVMVVDAPQTAPALVTASDTTTAQQAPTCTASIAVSSANLRSGPGTGYSILGYGYRDQSYPVGGQNPGGSWIVIATDTGSAWTALSNVQTQGDCGNLTVFNIPGRNAQPAPLIITTGGSTGGQQSASAVGQSSAPSTGFTGGGSSSSGGGESEHEHEGGD